MYEDFKQGLTEFTNNPLVISIVVILVILLCSLVVLSRTSIGRKILKSLIEKFDSLKAQHDEVKKVVKEYREKADQFEQDLKSKVDDFKKETENKVSAVLFKYQWFENSLYAILDEIPNEKVKAKVKELKAEAETKEKEIQALIGDTYNTIQEKINNEVLVRTKEIRNEAKNEINALKAEVANLEEFIKEITKVPVLGENAPQNAEEGKHDGEQNEETKND